MSVAACLRRRRRHRREDDQNTEFIIGIWMCFFFFKYFVHYIIISIFVFHKPFNRKSERIQHSVWRNENICLEKTNRHIWRVCMCYGNKIVIITIIIAHRYNVVRKLLAITLNIPLYIILFHCEFRILCVVFFFWFVRRKFA